MWQWLIIMAIFPPLPSLFFYMIDDVDAMRSVIFMCSRYISKVRTVCLEPNRRKSYFRNIPGIRTRAVMETWKRHGT